MRYWLTVTLLVGIAMLALALLWFVFPQKDVEGRGNTLQASVIVILAVTTVYYAWQTKVLADATGNRVPELTLWSVPDMVMSDAVRVNIQNCGRGPAREIKVECWWKKDTGIFFFVYDGPSSLNAGDMRLFGCRPVGDNVPAPPAVGDFVTRITWQDFDDKGYRPRIETTMNEHMRAFQTKFNRHAT